MRQRLQEMRDHFVQSACARRCIACRHVESDPGAAPPIGREQPFFLQFGVRARYRIGRDTEVAGELAYGRENVTRTQVAAGDETAKLLHNLLEWREVGIDRKKNLAHDAETD